MKTHVQSAHDNFWLASIVILVAATWFAIIHCWNLHFWETWDEYAYLSLADASNLDVWLTKGIHAEDSGLATHPGVPFYIISWLCLRLSATLAGHANAVEFTFRNPELFFLTTRIAAGLICIGSIVFAWRVLEPLQAPWKAVALCSFFAADPWSFIYGLSFLASETFALPLAALLFWAVKRAAEADNADLRPWVICGAVAALGYLVKLTYIFVAVGIVVAIFYQGVTASGDLRTKASFIFSRLAVVLATMISVSAAVLLLLEGWSGLHGLLVVHADFLFHTRVSDGGGGSTISQNVMMGTASKLSHSSPVLLLTAAILIAGAACYLTDVGGRRLQRYQTEWLVVGCVTLAFTTLAILNHFQPYYIPAVAALLPFALRVPLESRLIARLSLPILGFALAFSADSAVSAYSKIEARSDRMRSDERAILSAPLDRGEHRLWTYRTPSRYFADEFSLQLAGLQDYAHQHWPWDANVSSYANVPGKYRYVVFDREYHPDIAGLKKAAEHGMLTEPNGMKVLIDPAAKYRLLGATILVENPSAGGGQERQPQR